MPHFLPGTNPFINEFAKMYNIPLEAVRGGAETMYPEYRKKLQDKYVAPKNACGIAANGQAAATGRFWAASASIPKNQLKTATAPSIVRSATA